MKMAKKFLRLNLGVISLLLLFSSVSSASEAQERLALWRAHILSKGNLGGVEYNSDDFRALVQMGPNCLPEVFSAYRQEADPHVLYYYSGLIRRIAHFNVFRYSKEPLKINGYELQCTENIPFLSIQIGKNGLSVLPHPLYITVTKDKLVKWWEQRASFLKRDQIATKIRAATGKSHQEFLEYDKIKAQQLFKLSVYGIYNIPYFLDIIDQDNNPIIFCEFLRISGHPEYNALRMTSDVVANTWKADGKYPTRELKVKLICDWWKKAAKTYTNLGNLYSEIDRRIKKLSNQNP
ncbi:MAG: hypothetical protein ACYTDW_12575 [Planctomycetota bacterium]|jgi:hypothetical protein